MVWVISMIAIAIVGLAAVREQLFSQNVALIPGSEQPANPNAWPVSLRLEIRTPDPKAEGSLQKVAEILFQGDDWTRWQLQEVSSGGEIACYVQDGFEMRDHVLSLEGCDGPVDYRSRAESNSRGEPLPHAVNEHFVSGLMESALDHGRRVDPPDRTYPQTPREHLVVAEVRGECAAGRCKEEPADNRLERWVFDGRTGMTLYRQVVVNGSVVYEVEAVEVSR